MTWIRVRTRARDRVRFPRGNSRGKRAAEGRGTARRGVEFGVYYNIIPFEWRVRARRSRQSTLRQDDLAGSPYYGILHIICARVSDAQREHLANRITSAYHLARRCVVRKSASAVLVTKHRVPYPSTTPAQFVQRIIRYALLLLEDATSCTLARAKNNAQCRWVNYIIRESNSTAQTQYFVRRIVFDRT